MVDLAKYQILGGIRGIASGYEARIRSMFGDQIIRQGAWKAAIKGQVRILWSHEYNQLPVGITTHLADLPDGLYFEAVVVDAPGGKDIMQAIRAGLVNEVSVTASIDEWTYSEEEQAKIITEIGSLVEISPVNFGANPKTHVESFDLTDPQKLAILDLLRQETLETE